VTADGYKYTRFVVYPPSFLRFGVVHVFPSSSAGVVGRCILIDSISGRTHTSSTVH
jgi:hypothetical protein